MSNIETAEIIQFAAIRPKVGKPIALRRGTESEPRDIQENVSDTCRNQRLRSNRRDVWWKADALREYWRESMRMMDAVSLVQSHDLPEGNLHPKYSPQERRQVVANYREAIVRQLLTPAPRAANITWKRATFKHGDHEYTDIKPERIERAIADDVEFLRAHPTRRSLGSNSDA
jgi:hypothetical protein